jgi:hypothetical protein
MAASTDLNFELIWPDSEDLFQTIMSTELMIATRPSNNGEFSFDSPLAIDPALSTSSPFSDQVESVQTIPSGSNQRAVQDVSKMISSLVGPAAHPI